MLNLAHLYADGRAALARQIEDAIDLAVAEEKERILSELNDIETYRVFNICRQDDLQKLIERVFDVFGADDLIVRDLNCLFLEMKEMQEGVDLAIDELKEKLT